MLNNMENVFHVGMTKSITANVDGYISTAYISALLNFSAWYTSLINRLIIITTRAKVSCKLG